MTNEATYKVKTEAFEGPFNLLLSLVEERKLFINEISLAQVTEEYLKYVNESKDIAPENLTGFISVAATLILIKSKSLLPGINLTEEEEVDIKSLEERLRLYELFSNIAEEIRLEYGKQIIFFPEERKLSGAIFTPDPQITPENIYNLAEGLFEKLPKKEKLPEVEVKKVISLEEMIDRLTDRMQNAIKTSFKEFAGTGGATKEEKVVVIVGFLALLELTRQGILDVAQETNFEDIIITTNEQNDGFEE